MPYDLWLTTEPPDLDAPIVCDVADCSNEVDLPGEVCDACQAKHDAEHGPKDTGDAWTGGWAANH